MTRGRASSSASMSAAVLDQPTEMRNDRCASTPIASSTGDGSNASDEQALPELRALPGADPWRHRDMVVRQWVLVPESFHDDSDGLLPWVRKAHAAALDRGPASHRHSSRRPPARRKTASTTPKKIAPARGKGRGQSSKKV